MPARRVVAVDVTAEVTVASTVAAFINVVSGRVAASWIQIADGPIAGRGTRTAPAVAGTADLWHLPVAAVGAGRRDVVAVSNPSAGDDAEVDLEIIPEDPELRVNPIEITVRPGRTTLVDLSQQGRLEGIGHFSLAVRSLAGVPVAASVTSVSSTSDDSGGAGAAVAGSTATIGADGAARRWLVPAEVTDPDRDAGWATPGPWLSPIRRRKGSRWSTSASTARPSARWRSDPAGCGGCGWPGWAPLGSS